MPTRYTSKTKGSVTVIRKRDSTSGTFVPKRGTSSPTYEEIKHLIDKYPASAKKPKDKRSR